MFAVRMWRLEVRHHTSMWRGQAYQLNVKCLYCGMSCIAFDRSPLPYAFQPPPSSLPLKWLPPDSRLLCCPALPPTHAPPSASPPSAAGEAYWALFACVVDGCGCPWGWMCRGGSIFGFLTWAAGIQILHASVMYAPRSPQHFECVCLRMLVEGRTLQYAGIQLIQGVDRVWVNVMGCGGVMAAFNTWATG